LVAVVFASCSKDATVAIACFNVPLVKTSLPLNIGTNSALIGGIAYDNGCAILSRGVCWSTSPNPTIDLETKTVNGSGSGEFKDELINLEEDQRYYLRAYATNEAGTGYGSSLYFTTRKITDPVHDSEGNVYQTIKIGDQIWMAENLKSTKYCNGDLIPNVTGNNWFSLTSDAWSYYNNQAENNAMYGKLYNWYAATDKRNICPCNWHLPTREEWMALMDYVGRNGGKLKSVTGWEGPNIGATNETGFNGLPAGYRGPGNFVLYFGRDGGWWKNHLYSEALNLTSYSDGMGNVALDKTTGASVRCLKD